MIIFCKNNNPLRLFPQYRINFFCPTVRIMTDEKHSPEKSAKPDSSEKNDPIDLTALMKSKSEEDDDGIIELKDEVKIPPKKKKETGSRKPEAEIGAQDGEMIELTDEVGSESKAEEEIEIPNDLDPGDKTAEDAEPETEEEDLFALTDEMAVDFENEADLADIEDDVGFEEDEEEDVFTLTDDVDVSAEHDDQLLKPIDDSGLDFGDDDDEVILTDEADIEARDNDIIEINEFDEQFPAEGQETAGLAEIEDLVGTDEDEFLELIDVEEDGSPEEDDIIDFEADEESMATEEEFGDGLIDFGTDEDEMEDAEIDNFFREPFDEEDEEIEFDRDVEDEVAESLGMDLDSDMDMAEDEAQAVESLGMDSESEMDMAVDEYDDAAESLKMNLGSDIDTRDDESEEATANFKLDTDIITGKKEELGTLLFDNFAADDRSAPDDEQLPQEDEAGFEAADANAEVADLGTISTQQIEEAVERLIQSNYSEKIESIIVNVIERAVSREIEKLKDALLKDISESDME